MQLVFCSAAVEAFLDRLEAVFLHRQRVDAAGEQVALRLGYLAERRVKGFTMVVYVAHVMAYLQRSASPVSESAISAVEVSEAKARI